MAKADGILEGAARFDEALMARGVGRRHASWREPGILSPWSKALASLLGRTHKDGFLAVLMGRPGVGKTQMSIEWLRHVLASTKDPRNIEQYAPGWLKMHILYRKASDVFRDIRETFDKNDKSERAVVNRFRTVQALVIDEIDSRGRTEFEQCMLRDILDERYCNMCETVIITNAQSRHAFMNQVPEYLRSRLSETGLFIECNWPSFREMR